MFKILAIACISAATVLGAAIVVAHMNQSYACTKLGGTLVSRPNTNVGLNPQGEVVMTSSEGKVCVNPAGQVLQ